jgi:hypothetical protein
LLSHLCAVEHCRVELEGPPCKDEIFRVVLSAAPVFYSTTVALRSVLAYSGTPVQPCHYKHMQPNVLQEWYIRIPLHNNFYSSRNISLRHLLSVRNLPTARCFIRSDIRYTLPCLRASSGEDIKFGLAVLEGLTN